MFLIFIKQVISKTNNGLLMEISGGGGGGGGFPRQRCDALDDGKTPLLTLTKKNSISQIELNI